MYIDRFINKYLFFQQSSKQKKRAIFNIDEADVQLIYAVDNVKVSTFGKDEGGCRTGLYLISKIFSGICSKYLQKSFFIVLKPGLKKCLSVIADIQVKG